MSNAHVPRFSFLASTTHSCSLPAFGGFVRCCSHSKRVSVFETDDEVCGGLTRELGQVRQFHFTLAEQYKILPQRQFDASSSRLPSLIYNHSRKPSFSRSPAMSNHIETQTSNQEFIGLVPLTNASAASHNSNTISALSDACIIPNATAATAVLDDFSPYVHFSLVAIFFSDRFGIGRGSELPLTLSKRGLFKVFLRQRRRRQRLLSTIIPVATWARPLPVLPTILPLWQSGK